MNALLSDRWTEIGVAAVCVIIVAVVGGLMTEVGEWYESLRFPSWRPPNWLFGPAWTTIYLLIATSSVMAWERAPDGASRRWLLVLLAINAVLNILWSPLFFKLRRPDWAFVELLPLWASILALLIHISGISTLAGCLIAPYLAWVTFAGFLNWRVVQLNKPFGGASRVAEKGSDRSTR
jgi:tryptophan-rich sensory protein